MTAPVKSRHIPPRYNRSRMAHILRRNGRKALSHGELVSFIEGIPNLTAQWTSPNFVRRKTKCEIAALVAHTIREAGLQVSIADEEEE